MGENQAAKLRLQLRIGYYKVRFYKSLSLCLPSQSGCLTGIKTEKTLTSSGVNLKKFSICRATLEKGYVIKRRIKPWAPNSTTQRQWVTLTSPRKMQVEE